MKALVTGDAGYIGSHLKNKLLGLGWEVFGLDKLRGHREDITDEYVLSSGMFKNNIDVIFHLAAYPRVSFSYENPSYTLYNNVYGTSLLLEKMVKYNIKKIIYSSTSAVYGDGFGPISPYGLQKLMAEQEIEYYHKTGQIEAVVLRYFNVYSEDQKPDASYPTVFSAWMQNIRDNNKCIINGDGNIKRDYIHVSDIVDANISACKICDNKSKNIQCYDIGNQEAWSLNQLKNMIKEIRNKTKFAHGPPRQGDPLYTCANESCSTFKLYSGWEPKINIQDGIRRCFGQL